MIALWLSCGWMLAQSDPTPGPGGEEPPAAASQPVSSACAFALDLSGGLGMLWFAESNGQGWAGAAAVAVTLAATPCAHLPVRIEVHAATTSRGPPWGDGVRAVEVSQWSSDFSAAAGVAYPLVVGSSHAVGVDALVGPSLRVTRVGIRVYDETDHTTALRLFAGAALGGYLTLDHWRFALRVSTLLPWQSEVGLTAMVGHSL
ncbi:MAG: hypothetical protein HYZ27_07665 [Deltaproteobacteria bacterium]|nr:hypothetical protein [Deltaproteobacteria bacterium]